MIKVLIVDHSALIRVRLGKMIDDDADFELVGATNSGLRALDLVQKLGPDVVLVDTRADDLDGISLLKRLMKDWPVPVIMLAESDSEDANLAVEAMREGAVDFVLKSGDNLLLLAEEFKAKAKAVAVARLQKFSKSAVHPKRRSFFSSRKKIVVIASSTGGPQTVEALLTALPKNFPVPILIVQHMPPVFTKSFAERLDRICEISVKEAQDGDELLNGRALIAPGGFHMELVAEVKGMEGVIRLNNRDPPQLGVRPNADRLFNSVARIFGENTIGVVLTGMGCDGTAGCRTIKELHGTVLAEAESSCIIYGMPRSVIEKGLADIVVTLEDMPVALIQLVDI